ncbi:hypothetical protein BK126_26165 [Paenibacillus sp. FSL H7-0326]|uniref:hypothetical protein n=1 Tax=Paenibacillus sp. FSL H7-0326 TaxID=1921144 RepID=UPI00096F43D8|nr:hypothetical protein [Paenibacillus sp. FSL H7-0326]OMC63682.1 hypothetical protein BK126_26165 [Paenibacillus sp. FSL H7-0326]
MNNINPLYTTTELDEVQATIENVGQVIGSEEHLADPDLQQLMNELLVRRSELISSLASSLGISSQQLVRKRLGIEA